MSGPGELAVDRVQPASNKSYAPSKITLFGVPLQNVEATLGAASVQVTIETALKPAEAAKGYAVALIYGYAYQGHCYALPEPTAMVVPAKTEAGAVGCNYVAEAPYGYRMWQVDRLDRTVQLQLSNDSFEELLLKRSMGGSRPPLAYHSTMQMSHRGGKLSE